MRSLALSTALLALAACTTPSSGPLPAGAVSFAEVLQAQSGRSYECSDYDPQTRTCAAYGTYRQQADGGLVSEGYFLLSDSPRVLVQGVAPAYLQNGRLCTRGDAIEMTIVEGQSNPSAEFALGFIEGVVVEAGVVCSTYTPNGDGYSVSTVAQSGGFGGPIPSSSVFFASPPALRSEL